MIHWSYPYGSCITIKTLLLQVFGPMVFIKKKGNDHNNYFTSVTLHIRRGFCSLSLAPKPCI